MNQTLLTILWYVCTIITGAFVARYAMLWIAGFKPRYTKTLVSTTVAYAIINVIGLVLYGLGSPKGLLNNYQAVMGLAILTTAHVNLVKSDTGASITPGKAVLVVLCQMLGAAFLTAFIMLPITAAFRVPK